MMMMVMVMMKMGMMIMMISRLRWNHHTSLRTRLSYASPPFAAAQSWSNSLSMIQPHLAQATRWNRIPVDKMNSIDWKSIQRAFLRTTPKETGSSQELRNAPASGCGWEWCEYILQWAQRRCGSFWFWDEPVSFAWTQLHTGLQSRGKGESQTWRKRQCSSTGQHKNFKTWSTIASSYRWHSSPLHCDSTILWSIEI